MFKYVKELFRDVVMQSQKFVGLNGSINSREINPPEEMANESGASSMRRNFMDRVDPREIPRPLRMNRSLFRSMEQKSCSNCSKEESNVQGKNDCCGANGVFDEETAVKKEEIEEKEETTRKEENCCRKCAEENCNCDNCAAIGTMSECGVCLEPLQSRSVRSCPLCANLVCADCASRLSKCAFCRTCRPNQRNRAVERLLARLYLPCKNARSGCKKILKSEDRLRHEASCDHASITCPVSKGTCSWQGSPVSMLSHLKQVHGLRPLADHGIAVEISSFRQKALAKEGEYTIYLSCYSQLFAVKVILHRKKLILTFSQLGYVSPVTEKITSSRYGVWIKVNGGSKQIRGVLPFGKFNRETREIEINSDKLFCKRHGKNGDADIVKIEISIKEISALR